jgi:NTP pyrophosphatase (non-canonical NTP hydrolase)
MKSVAHWQRDIHDLAVEKGWYDGTPRSPLEMLALIVSEAGEAINEARVDRPAVYFICKATGKPLSLKEVNRGLIGFNHWKPEGEAVELADVIIRCLDYAAHRGWEMEELV